MRESPERAARAGRRAVFAVLAALLLTLAGCADPTPPSTAGVRIACISPGAAATLVGWGIGVETPSAFGVQIVGRHDYDLVLPRSVPACGHQNGLDYERLLGLDPTHVVIEWGERPLPDRLVSLAGAHGWEIVELRMLSLEQIGASLTLLDSTFATGPAARSGVSAEPFGSLTTEWLDPDRLGVDPARASSIGPVLIVASTAPSLGAAGPGSWHLEILQRLGGRSALPADAAAWVSLGAEDVLQLAPEAVVILDPRPPGTGEPSWPAASPPWPEVERRLGVVAGFRDIPAVASRRVAVITDPLVNLPGTPVIGYARELAGVLRAWGSSPEQ